MASEQDILEAVDSTVDDIDIDAIEEDAKSLGLTLDAYLTRVRNEIKTRLSV